MKAPDERESLVSTLRDANRRLVLAALDAQDMQIKAELDRVRQQEFLATLAHELRNPLASISMAVNLLETISSAHPRLPGLHNILHRQVAHLTHLVDDLLDAARVNTGKISPQRHPLLLSE